MDFVPRVLLYRWGIRPFLTVRPFLIGRRITFFLTNENCTPNRKKSMRSVSAYKDYVFFFTKPY